MRTTLLAVFACMLLSTTPSKAQLDQNHARAWDRHEGGQQRVVKSKRSIKKKKKRSQVVQSRFSPPIANHPVTRTINAVTSTVARILPHPPGCPRRLFCGCGAAVEVFGRPIRSLWLAANWLKFPAARPAPGMVAARGGGRGRYGHVMVIKKYLGNNQALVYNANGGRGRTYLHVRSIAGFKIVNPRT